MKINQNKERRYFFVPDISLRLPTLTKCKPYFLFLILKLNVEFLSSFLGFDVSAAAKARKNVFNSREQ